MIRSNWQRAALGAVLSVAAAISVILLIPAKGRADEPYARSRDYDLQHVKTHLWFDFDHKSFHGEVTHSVAMLHDNVSEIQFDSVDLKIDAVTLDGKAREIQGDGDRRGRAAERAVEEGRQARDFHPLRGIAEEGICISSGRTKIIRTGRRKFGRRASPKTRATTFRSTTIRTTGQLSEMIMTVPGELDHRIERRAGGNEG